MLNKFIRDKQPPEVIENARARSEKRKLQLPDAANETETNQRFAEIFLRDAHRSIALLDAFIEKGGSYSEDEIRTFVIHTHGMKSALTNIGKANISALALKLEMLGRDNNIEALTAETPAFLSSLKALVDELSRKKETAGEEPEVEDKQYLTNMLLKIKAACDEYNENIAENTLIELKKLTWSKQTKDLLDRIDERLLHCDFDEIIADISKFIDSI
jgi:HPt (histidine-containing phosphotransfer) domain-containing protein